MKEEYLSTNELASILNVTETTIKRWTDSGRLRCIKTLGGHRKYLLRDVEEFGKENNIPLSGIIVPLRKDHMEKLGFALYSKNMQMVADIFQGEALQGNLDEIFEMLIYLIKNRLKFVEIIDEIIQPVMQNIGFLWENDKLNVGQEHLASNTIRTALSRMIVYLPRQKDKKIKVLCVCSEGDTHDMGLLLLGYGLELSGYTIYFLGANTPFKFIVNAIKKEKPNWVLLSATAPSISKDDFIIGVKNIIRAVSAVKSKLVLGGRYSQNFQQSRLDCYIANSLKETFLLLTNK